MPDDAIDSSRGTLALQSPGSVRLDRSLGLLNAVTINMSNMIGTGPFITVPALLATMGGPQSLIAWFVGAVLAIADGLVFAELGAAIPASGGCYIFLRETYGRERWGRMISWVFVLQFMFSGTLEIATSSIGMAQYAGFIWQPLLAHPWALKASACAITAVAMLALYRKIKDIARLMMVLWIGMLITVVWVIAVGFTHMHTANLFSLPSGAWHIGLPFMLGLGNGTMLVMFNFLGYYQSCYLGEEIKRPERNIPRSVILSILVVALIDFLVSVSFTGVVPWREMIRPDSPAFSAIGSVFAERTEGHWASYVMTAMVEVTAFASTFAMMLGYSRIPYAAAVDGAFFQWFGKLHPTRHFPHRALLFVGVLCMAACCFDLLQIITALMLARIVSMFIAQIIGLLIWRKRQPEAPRPFRMWLYPAPAILALAGWIWVFGTSAAQPGGWLYVTYALVTIGLGFGGYFIFAWRRGQWPFRAGSGSLLAMDPVGGEEMQPIALQEDLS